MSGRLKVLMSAYACEPGKGSESAGGWNQVFQVARFHEVWVITRANNREPIEKDPASRSPYIHWVYFDLPWILRFWKKGNRGIQLYYFLWQIGIFFVARRLHREIRFDLTHHFTLVRYWTPSFLSFISAPMIFGPVGGGESAPKNFYRTFSFRGRIYEHTRDFIRWAAENDPIARIGIQKAVAVLATTEQTAECVHKMGARRVFICTSFALTETEMAEFTALPAKRDKCFRVISMGRLLHWKGFHLGLQAFAQFCKTHPDSEYWIVNNGPEKKRLQQLAEQLGIADRVTFWGKLPTLGDVHAKLSQCDVLVHPSLHDSFGNVCLEALATGKPVICLDLGGPAMQVTADCGFKIYPGTPDQAIADMAAVMEKLYRNPELKTRLGLNGQRRVRDVFCWDAKGDEINQLYQKAVGRKLRKPRPEPTARLKVLMSAYACEPGKGSEPEVGWQWALQMARFHDVTVLTRENNRPAIESAVATLRGKQPLPEFIYHEESSFLVGFKKQFQTTKLYYLLWQRSARDRVTQLQAEHSFDLFHHVTFAGMRYPAAIWGHGVPCVWGPIGGIESVPPWLLPWQRPGTLLKETSRNLHNFFQSAFFTVLSKRARASTVTLVSTPEMGRTFSALGFETQLMPTIGLNTADLDFQPRAPSSRPLKLLYVGNVITLKGVDLAIRALKASQTNATLTLVGDGDYLPAIRRLTEKLNLSERVHFRGRLPRQEVLQTYSEFDVFIFPSLHDTGGYAVIEAMFNELPVICLDCGGPAVAVQDRCGTKIPLGRRAKVIAELASAIRRYDQNPELVQQHGQAAREVVLQNYNWEKKGEQMKEVYKKASTAFSENPSPRDKQVYTGFSATTLFLQRMISLRGFIALTMALLVAGLLGFLSLSHLKSVAKSIVSDTLPGLSFAGEANAYIADANRTLLYVVTDDAERRAQLRAEIDSLSRRTSGYLEKYRAQIFSEEDRSNFNTLIQNRNAYIKVRNHVLDLAEAGKQQESILEFNQTLMPEHARVRSASDKLFAFNIQQGEIRSKAIMRACTFTQIAVAVIGIIVFVLGFFIGLFR